MVAHYEHHMLPPIHSGMFKQEGYVHIGISRMTVAPNWKVELWLYSLVFYTNLNDMYLTRKEVKHGVLEFNWEPR